MATTRHVKQHYSSKMQSACTKNFYRPAAEATRSGARCGEARDSHPQTEKIKLLDAAFVEERPPPWDGRFFCEILGQNLASMVEKGNWGDASCEGKSNVHTARAQQQRDKNIE